MDACTIVAKNYLAYARVLARSWREHNPGSACHVLIIDEHEGRLADDEPFTPVTIGELGIERFDRMSALYDVLELSTAVKPWLMRHLLERSERVLYLDPDIRLFDPLDEVDALLRDHRVVVTPHLTEPMPRDGRKPSEADILTSGAYNLGFLGLSRGDEVTHLLDWWAERLETDCVIDPRKGLFVDQRWIDFAPGLVESFHVLRDPGYNVAYWNLGGRELSARGTRARGDHYEVNGRPLRFFHFSGFRPERRDVLSKHQDRIAIRPGTPLATLCDSYADELLAAGYDEASAWEYTYAALPNGLELDKPMRAVYRDAVADGALPKPVFAPEGANELVDYLNGPAEEGGEMGVTRYLAALHSEHRQLQIDFPDLRGPDALHFIAWAEAGGGIEIPSQLLPSNATEPVRTRSTAPRAGVNLAGYFGSVLGVGEVARQVVDALEGANVAVAPVGVVASHSPQEGPAGDRGHAPFPINLVCVNADALPNFADEMGPDFFAGRHSIGLWWWEVADFPERFHGSFDLVDEVWAGTHHVADALAAVSPVPVVKVTVPVSVPPFEPLPRARLGLPEEGFLFLFSFDYNSVFARKNPLAVMEAFGRAFPEAAGAGGPKLVLKTLNSERDPESHARLAAAAAEQPDVVLIDRAMTREEKDALTAACDCYVSLHRSEGFGLGMAEAMALGKPVIATGYSGNLDFMDADTAYLVDHELVPIGPGADPYPPGGVWAEPSVTHAAALMRTVVGNPDAAAERGRRAAAAIARTHSPAAAGASMARRLVQIQSRWGLRGAGLARDRRDVIGAARIARRIRRGPTPANPGRLRRLREWVRGLVLRVLRPYSVYARDVDEDLLKAIQTVERSLHGLATAQAQLRPQVHRLIGEQHSPPAAPPGVGLREHPVAGVVSGFDASAEAAAEDDLAAEPDRRAVYSALLGGRTPVLASVEELGEAADGEAGAVVLAGVLDAVDPARVEELLRLALRRLAPGGVLVAECVNPHAAAAMKSFWADPAKVRPVFPETALALARRAGFETGFVFHPDGSGNVEADRFYERRYALVAEAPAGRGPGPLSPERAAAASGEGA